MKWPWSKPKPAGQWMLGPTIGNRRGSYQRRFWVPADQVHRYQNPKPPGRRRCGSKEAMIDEMLRTYVLNQLDRIIAEIAVPLNSGLIPTSLAIQLKGVVEAWPDVTIHGPIERVESVSKIQEVGIGGVPL